MINTTAQIAIPSDKTEVRMNIGSRKSQVPSAKMRAMCRTKMIAKTMPVAMT